MNSMNQVKKQVFGAVFVGGFVVLLLLCFKYAATGVLEWTPYLFKEVFVDFGFSFCIYIFNVLLSLLIIRTIKNDAEYKKRILVFIPCSLLITVFFVIITEVIFNGVSSFSELADFLKNFSFHNLVLPLIITIIVLTAVFGWMFYKAYLQQQQREQNRKAESQLAQLQSLKNQLDPHFLFNSLNVLTGLIQENPTQAEVFTRSLSKIYRYVLEQKNKDLVPLVAELNFARRYMQLLELRFESGLEFTIEAFDESEEDFQLVSLSLQILLENALKHNQTDLANPLRVVVSKERDYLVVTNTLNPKQSWSKESKVGLSNVVQRYKMLTARPVCIDCKNGLFVVKLPLIACKK